MYITIGISCTFVVPKFYCTFTERFMITVITVRSNFTLLVITGNYGHSYDYIIL